MTTEVNNAAHPGLTNQESARVFVQLARMLASNTTECLHRAKECLVRAMTLDPDNHHANNDLGLLLASHETIFIAGKVWTAQSLFIAAVHLCPEDAAGFLNLSGTLESRHGTVTLQGGRVLTQVDLLAEAIRLRPRYADAYNNLGLSLSMEPGGSVVLHDGREMTATNLFVEAIKLRPDMGAPHNNLAMELKPQESVVLSDGTPMNAKTLLVRAISLEPQNGYFYSNLSDHTRSDEVVTLQNGTTLTKRQILRNAHRKMTEVRCFACGKHSAPAFLKRCGACRDAYYCNQKCQKKHWNTHRAQCCRY